MELAELAGCSTRFVHTVEAGKPTLRLDELLAVLGVLGLRLEVLGQASTQGSAVGADLQDRAAIAGLQDKVSGRMISLPVTHAGSAWILKLNPPEFQSELGRLSRFSG